MFIGYLSLANVVTLSGLVFSVTSCFLAANGNFKFAVYILFLACICDAFDGKIARMNKNRTPAERFYGVQLDSLCDVISFGVTPCFIAFSLGFKGWFDVIIYCFFIICGVTRLAYFNTLSNQNNGKAMKSYRGMPIPMSTMMITFLILLTTFIGPNVTHWLFRLGFIATAVLFVLNIKVKKPNTRRSLILLSVESVMLILILVIGPCLTY